MRKLSKCLNVIKAIPKPSCLNMPTVYNISRRAAERYDRIIDPTQYCWISIHEPDSNEHVENPILDRCENVKMRFWDLDVPSLPFTPEGEILYPPTEEDAKQIVDFLLENKGKNVIANCRAGQSRSSAISLFCVDILKYDWDLPSEGRAVPNMKLYRMMVSYYVSLYGVPTKIVDKRNR